MKKGPIQQEKALSSFKKIPVKGYCMSITTLDTQTYQPKINHHSEIIDAIRDRPGITPIERLVFIILTTYSNKNGESMFPSYQTLANGTGLSKRMVIKAIKSICAKGLLTKKPSTKALTNEYKIHLYGLLNYGESDAPTNEIDSEPRSPQVVNHVHPPSEPRSPKHTNYQTILTKKEEEIFVSVDKSKFSEEFEEVWRGDIRQQRKECAWKEYQKVLGEVSHEELAISHRAYVGMLKHLGQSHVSVALHNWIERKMFNDPIIKPYRPLSLPTNVVIAPPKVQIYSERSPYKEYANG